MKVSELLAGAIYRAEAEADARVSGRAVDWDRERDDIRRLYLRDAEAALRGLADHGYEVGPGWREIERAPPPPDSPCILYHPNSDGPGEIRIGTPSDGGGAVRPSHWRPLPAPPSGD